MQARYINELVEGARLDADVMLRAKELRVARNGDPYLRVEFADRSGAIPGVMFRPAPESVEVPNGTVVRVSGTVTTYRGTRRLSIDRMVPAVRWDAHDLISPSPRPVAELESDFRGLCASVKSASMRGLLRGVFGDKQFFERFRECPASACGHHAHLSGLMEHTIAVAAACDVLAPRYPEADRDLLVSAALLHDIGKVDELEFGSGISLTDEGRLLGHVVLGVERIRAAARPARVDAGAALRVEHAVLTHHAATRIDIERQASTLEAMLLRHLDSLDATAAEFSHAVAGATRVEESWTVSHNGFGRPLLAVQASYPGDVAEQVIPDPRMRLTA